MSDSIVTRTMLLEAIWDFHFDPGTNIVETHICRLRAKIDRGGDPSVDQDDSRRRICDSCRLARSSAPRASAVARLFRAHRRCVRPRRRSDPVRRPQHGRDGAAARHRARVSRHRDGARIGGPGGRHRGDQGARRAPRRVRVLGRPTPHGNRLAGDFPDMDGPSGWHHIAVDERRHRRRAPRGHADSDRDFTGRRSDCRSATICNARAPSRTRCSRRWDRSAAVAVLLCLVVGVLVTRRILSRMEMLDATFRRSRRATSRRGFRAGRRRRATSSASASASTRCSTASRSSLATCGGYLATSPTTCGHR